DQQAVEEAGTERHLAAHLVDVELAAEPPHGVLEGLRPAVGAERDRLPVEDGLVGGEAADALDRLGPRGGERLAVATVDLGALALERALAQLADQPARQEGALRRRGAGEQLAEPARALGRRPFPGEVANGSQGSDDVLEAERRLRSRCGRPPRLVDRRRPD